MSGYNCVPSSAAIPYTPRICMPCPEPSSVPQQQQQQNQCFVLNQTASPMPHPAQQRQRSCPASNLSKEKLLPEGFFFLPSGYYLPNCLDSGLDFVWINNLKTKNTHTSTYFTINYHLPSCPGYHYICNNCMENAPADMHKHT